MALAFAQIPGNRYGNSHESGFEIMMRREFVRRPSRAARLALPPAVFAPVLAAVATLFHRLGWMEDQNYIIVLFVSFLLALAGAGLALMGLRSLWTRASLGGLRSAAALFFTLPVLAPAGLALWLASTTAPLSDVSTDLDDPPHFSNPGASRPAANVNEPPRLKPDLQKQFYPSVTGRRYQLSADAIHAHVLALFKEAGWTVRGGGTFESGAGEWQVEGEVTTPIAGFRDEVIVRLTDEGESTFVDIRSASMFGANDLGTNARRIVDFMKGLDLLVQSTGFNPQPS